MPAKLVLVLLPEFFWGEPHIFFKKRSIVALVAKMEQKRNFRNGYIRMEQKINRLFNPLFIYIIRHRYAGLFFKQVGQVARIQVNMFRQQFKLEIKQKRQFLEKDCVKICGTK